MATIRVTEYFETEEEAKAFAEIWAAGWGIGSGWNPYQATVTISPPNHDRATWAVYTSRADSCD